MTRVIVLRPQPGADATVRRAKAMGFDAVATPLFAVRAVDWDAPDPAGFDALLLTSANAVRMAGPALARYHGLPLFAVGGATAQAAQDSGFGEIVSGEGDGAAIIRLAIAHGSRRLLHLAGRDHVDLPDQGAVIERRIVYASDAATTLPEPARAILAESGVALLHSARAAALFARLADAAGLDRSHIVLACLSPAILTAAGTGWKQGLTAPVPSDQALLEIAARLCDQDTESRAGG